MWQSWPYPQRFFHRGNAGDRPICCSSCPFRQGLFAVHPCWDGVQREMQMKFSYLQSLSYPAFFSPLPEKPYVSHFFACIIGYGDISTYTRWARDLSSSRLI